MLISKKKPIGKRQLQAANTKNNIMLAAISLFASHGFEKVTIEDITQKAGTSKGSFYSHFKSKYDVVLERFADLNSANYEFYEKAQQKNEPFEQLLTYLQCTTDYSMNELGLDFTKVVYISQINDSSSANRFFLDESRPIFNLLDKIIKNGQKKGVFRKEVSSQAMVRLYIRLLRVVTYEWCMCDGRFNLTRESQKLFVEAFDMIKTH